jgi:hypothetical protein
MCDRLGIGRRQCLSAGPAVANVCVPMCVCQCVPPLLTVHADQPQAGTLYLRIYLPYPPCLPCRLRPSLNGTEIKRWGGKEGVTLRACGVGERGEGHWGLGAWEIGSLGD